jgi:hypothetical protein
MSAYTVEISDGQQCIPRNVIDSFEVYADTLLAALAKGYIEVDSAYIEVYGPSVAEWMQVRLTNTTTGKRSRWYTVDALGKVEA